MKLFNFLRKKKSTVDNIRDIVPDSVDKSKWTGKNFDFLITGEVQVSADEYDRIMTPNSFEWSKVFINNWSYYKVGQDEFGFSRELGGIQMSFNEAISYEKARKIADEIIENIKATGQTVELVVIGKSKIYRSM